MVQASTYSGTDLPLSSLFNSAQDILSLTETESSSDPQFLEDVKKGCQLLETCIEKIHNLHLFSSNEELDDISTGDLKYLLAPYYLVNLTQHLSNAGRRSNIKTSKFHLQAFLSQCEKINLLTKEEKERLERLERGGGGSMQKDPTSLRAEKIARFKYNKEIETKMKILKERRKALSKKKKQKDESSSNAHDEKEEEEEEDMEEVMDECDEREIWILKIKISIDKAIDLIEMLQKEEKMLEEVEKRKDEIGDALSRASLDNRISMAESRHRSASDQARVGVPSGILPITCPTFAQDVIEGRARIGNQPQHEHLNLGFGPVSSMASRLSTVREQMIARVFQPSHSLPRMSIEEAGLKDKAMSERIMNGGKESDGELSLDKPRFSNGDEDEEEEDEKEFEAKEYKTRSWDDWKDEHPKGSGNSKLTPCG